MYLDFNETYFNVWKIAWNFHKKYAAKSSCNADFWEQATEEAAELMKNCEGKPYYNFLKSLLIAVMGELQRQEAGG